MPALVAAFASVVRALSRHVSCVVANVTSVVFVVTLPVAASIVSVLLRLAEAVLNSVLSLPTGERAIESSTFLTRASTELRCVTVLLAQLTSCRRPLTGQRQHPCTRLGS